MRISGAMTRPLAMFATLLYSLAFHYAYVVYVNPAFAYAHYDYFEPPLPSLLLTYVLILAPLVLYKDAVVPASHGAALIFGLCYVPAQLMLLFTWQSSYAELQVVQLSLAGSMAIFVWISRFGGETLQRPWQSSRRLAPIVGFLSIAALLVLVLVYRDHMRLVSFAEIYDLRSETSEVETGAAIDYPVLWLSYCFLPFFFARGIMKRSMVDIGWGLLGCVLVYASNGAKAAILMPFIIFGIYVLLGSGRQFLLKLMLSLAVGVILVIVLLPDEGVLVWVKSILFVRVLGTGGWTLATYYDYFSTHGYTFYTHIGPVNALTDAYPYGELSLGQLIGLEYSGSLEANFNANFWASDAFAALGVAGVPIVTVAVAAVLYGINRTSRGYSPKFVTLWLSGFWLAMLNVPLTTALLSGGGALTMLLLWSVRKRRRAPRSAPEVLIERPC